MDYDRFEISRTDKELDEYGYYGEVRLDIAKKFNLSLELLYYIEQKKSVREMLLRLNNLNKIPQACILLTKDDLFMQMIRNCNYHKDTYRRFLFVVAPLVRNYNGAYLRKRELIEEKLGYKPTYVFEMSREFQQLCITLNDHEFDKFVRYKNGIVGVDKRTSKEKRNETVNLFFQKELYILDISDEKMKDLFSSINLIKLRRKMRELIDSSS